MLDLFTGPTVIGFVGGFLAGVGIAVLLATPHSQPAERTADDLDAYWPDLGHIDPLPDGQGVLGHLPIYYPDSEQLSRLVADGYVGEDYDAPQRHGPSPRQTRRL